MNQLDSDRVQYGGLHNTLLNCYFPATSNFMVKPIPRLRNVFASNEYLTGAISIDSYDPPVEADDISHFVVCKYGADVNGDIPLLVWELNRDDAGGVHRAAGQIERYRRWCAAYAEHNAAVGEQHAVYFAIIEQSSVILMVPSTDGLMMMKFVNVLDSRLHKILTDLPAKYE